MRTRFLALFAALVVSGPAQLTIDQRSSDFRTLVDLYARRYAPIQWKQSAVHFNLLDINPWLTRVAAATDDLSFYELMAEYVSDLKDAHDQYAVPSDFEAHLGFTVDVYDGKVLVDSIDRTILDAAGYPFQIGDQLISVDETNVADWLNLFSK